MKYALIFFLVFIAGCSTQPIKDNLTAKGNLGSIKKMERAIFEAMKPLWRGKLYKKGHIIASRSQRNYVSISQASHRAQVDIYFDSNSYKIKYKNSSYFKFDGENIHKKYNEWVTQLHFAISSYIRD